MNGTEANRFRFRDDSRSVVTGCLSMVAGAMLDPMVPAT